MATSAFAHAGHHHLEPAAVLRWWSWEPFVVLSLVIAGALYAIGIARNRRVAKPWQMACFAAGWIVLVIALVSPVDVLGEILFSAHMAQHELLMIVAAPLVVLGRPLVVFLWALPARWRPPAGQLFRNAWWNGAVTVTVLHAAALWMWHMPALYEATLRSDFIHALQHISFFFTAALFWWALIHGRYGRLGYGAAVVYVFITAGHSGALGALITLAPDLWYPIYGARTAAWGLSALEDQQLAGLIMWIPAGVLFTVLGIALFAAWLGEAERRVALTRSESLRKEQP
jgi:cytochrome c oxidase assembly factor CtaG